MVEPDGLHVPTPLHGRRSPQEQARLEALTRGPSLMDPEYRAAHEQYLAALENAFGRKAHGRARPVVVAPDQLISNRLYTMTDAERRLLDRVRTMYFRQGYSTQYIADDLGISEYYVREMIAAIKRPWRAP